MPFSRTPRPVVHPFRKWEARVPSPRSAEGWDRMSPPPPVQTIAEDALFRDPFAEFLPSGR